MSKSIIQATGVIMVMNLVVRLLGFLRETFIAKAFGASQFTDAYLIAYTLPYFLQAILGAALVAAVVPMLTKYLVEDNKEEAWYVGSSMFNLTFIGLAVASAIGMAIAYFLVQILAPGFDEEQVRLATELARVMFPSAVFMGLGMVATGILNASYRFAVGAFAPGFSSIIIICTTLIFATSYGIFGLSVGTLVSFIGFFLIQVPSLVMCGYRYKPVLGLKHPAVRSALKGLIPIILGVAVFQVYFALNRVFASALEKGTISHLNYANRVMLLPIGIFVSSIAATIYPSLSELALKQDKKHLEEILRKGLGLVSLISIPATVGLIVLRKPIIQILFEHGVFDHAATLATANALLFFSIGLLPMAANMILTRAFYSLNDVRTPLKLGAYSVIVDIVLCLAFFKTIPYGGGGLALANSLAALFGTWLLYIYLQKCHLPHLRDEGSLKNSLLKMGVSAVIMGIVVWAVDFAITMFMPGGGGKAALLIVGFGIISGCLVYGLTVYLLKIDEVQYILDIIKRRFKRAQLDKITGEKDG